MIAPSISSSRAVSRNIPAIRLFSMPVIIVPSWERRSPDRRLPRPQAARRHSERSGPILSSAPFCGASGRIVEESWHHHRVLVLFPIFGFRWVPQARSVCLGLGFHSSAILRELCVSALSLFFSFLLLLYLLHVFYPLYLYLGSRISDR